MRALPGFANPILVALDRPDRESALLLARRLSGTVGGLKAGLELFVAEGPPAIRALVSTGLPLFLDLKLHDIPNTVAGAVRAAAGLKAALLTVHAAGGRAMLDAAVAAAAAFGPHRPRLLAVTVLTSLDAADLAATGVRGAPLEQAVRLARLAGEAGLDGVELHAANGYLFTQLKQFNNRQRTDENQVMHVVVEKMTELEMAAVAEYLSGK